MLKKYDLCFFFCPRPASKPAAQKNSTEGSVLPWGMICIFLQV